MNYQTVDILRTNEFTFGKNYSLLKAKHCIGKVIFLKTLLTKLELVSVGQAQKAKLECC